MTEMHTPQLEPDGPFDDAPLLMELRSLISDLLTDFTEAQTTGNSGCGCGSADIEFEIEGIKFTVSISLSGDDEVEH